MVRCRRCNNATPETEFYPSDLKARWCKTCRNGYKKANKHKYKATEKAYNRKYRLSTLYNLSIAEYEDMVTSRNSCCDICHQSKELVVDHDHLTGRVRGLLCDICNIGIGALKENMEYLKNAMSYLEANRQG